MCQVLSNCDHYSKLEPDYGNEEHEHGGYNDHDPHEDHGHDVGGYLEHSGGHDRSFESSSVSKKKVPVYYNNPYDVDSSREESLRKSSYSKVFSSLNSIFPEQEENGFEDHFLSDYEGELNKNVDFNHVTKFT